MNESEAERNPRQIVINAGRVSNRQTGISKEGQRAKKKTGVISINQA